MAGVGGAAHPDELLDRLTDVQWAEWQLFAKHFLTPMQRADLNSALERQATLVPHCKRGKVPSVADLLPKYGRKGAPRRKTPAAVFRAAEAAFAAAASPKTPAPRKVVK